MTRDLSRLQYQKALARHGLQEHPLGVVLPQMRPGERIVMGGIINPDGSLRRRATLAKALRAMAERREG